MGWQLFPTGIGWREFSSTPSRGDFTCPNPRCTSAGAAQYQHKAGRNWFTVFFVPVIPLNKTGEWVRCTRCKSMYPLHVLGHASVPTVHMDPARPQQQVMPPVPPPPVAPVAVELPQTPIEPHVVAPLRPTPVPVLRFSDGAAIELTGVVVIGRDPAPMSDFASADMHAVADPTVSKTHLAVGCSGGDAWVLDNHSSNGVFVGPSLGEVTRIPAGRRTMLLPSSVVSIGDSTSFTVGA